MASLDARQPRSKFMKKREATYGAHANSPLQYQYPPVSSPASDDPRSQFRSQSRNSSRPQLVPGMAEEGGRSVDPGQQKPLPIVPSFGVAHGDEDEYHDDVDGESILHEHAHPHDSHGTIRPMQSNGSLRSGESRLTDNLDIPVTRQPKHIAVLQAHEIAGREDVLPEDYEVQNGTSSNQKFLRKTGRQREYRTQSSVPTTPDSRERSSAESIMSYDTSASSVQNLPALQEKSVYEEGDAMTPLNDDDPRNFDLVTPTEAVQNRAYSLEQRSEQMFSRDHLQEIFADSNLLLRFTNFLSTHRRRSIPLLIYYLDALKALRAINYANAVANSLGALEDHEFSQQPHQPTVNRVLEEKLRLAFDAMVKDDLPAYITHTFIQVVSVSIQRRITGTLPPHLREASEGLAEVFCLTDPSRPDNPIVFASEEFHRTSQYGVSYAIGRNCRFLQGPRTNPFSRQRLKKAVVEGREISEVFLNYRRDGSPFMNLLMIAPLLDSRGNIRYFIGAQVDVSGLVKDCTDLEGLQRMIAKYETAQEKNAEAPLEEEKKDEFQQLSEILNVSELESVRKHGGKMHREQVDDPDELPQASRPRLLLKDPHNDLYKSYQMGARANGKLEGIYQHYLLVRPYPSLRILFVSPSLRVPGILQSPLLSRIGGSARVHKDLVAALAEGRGVTAKVRWVSGRAGDDEGRPRWIHCTPLLGHNGAVGVWMIVIVDDESSIPPRRFRMAPPVAKDIGQNGVHSPRTASLAHARSHANSHHKPSRPPDYQRQAVQHSANSAPGLHRTASTDTDLGTLATAAGAAGSTASYPASVSTTRPGTRNGYHDTFASMTADRESTSSLHSFGLG